MFVYRTNLDGITIYRMEETVRNMMEYKSKIDQLKQEKSSLLLTYEVSLIVWEVKTWSSISYIYTDPLIVFLQVVTNDSFLNRLFIPH